MLSEYIDRGYLSGGIVDDLEFFLYCMFEVFYNELAFGIRQTFIKGRKNKPSKGRYLVSSPEKWGTRLRIIRYSVQQCPGHGDLNLGAMTILGPAVSRGGSPGLPDSPGSNSTLSRIPTPPQLFFGHKVVSFTCSR